MKLEFLEGGSRSIKVSKTRRVLPNISVHFLPEKDNSTLSVQLPSNKEDLTCRFSVCTKPTFGEYPELPTAVYFHLLSWSSGLLTMETRPIILTYLSQFYQFSISPRIGLTHIKAKVKTVYLSHYSDCLQAENSLAQTLEIPILKLWKSPCSNFENPYAQTLKIPVLKLWKSPCSNFENPMLKLWKSPLSNFENPLIIIFFRQEDCCGKGGGWTWFWTMG